MMYRKIERPETTTYVMDFPFHLVKDKKEAENIKLNKVTHVDLNTLS